MIYLVIILFVFLLFTDFWIIVFLSPLMCLYFRAKGKSRMHNGGEQNAPDSISQNIKVPLVKVYLVGISQFYISRLANLPSQHLRMFFYRKVCRMKLSQKVTIYKGLEVREPYLVKIGVGTIIGTNAILGGRNKIIIGDNVNLSSNVSIWTEQHDHRDPYFRCETQKKEPVVIGNRVW